MVESVVLQDTMPYNYPAKFKSKVVVVPVFWVGGRDTALESVAPKAIQALLDDKCVVPWKIKIELEQYSLACLCMCACLFFCEHT